MSSEVEVTGELLDSRDLLGDVEGLGARLSRDGYLYVSRALPPESLAALRDDILGILARHKWLDPEFPAAQARCGRAPVNEGEESYFPVYDEVQKLESFHGLAHTPALTELMQRVVGPTAFPHPLGIARLSFPDNQECTTPPHQDYPNNQGTDALYASWIPLLDCPMSLGGIAILEGSHALGLLPLSFSLGAGARRAVLPEEASGLRWLSTDFSVGDVLVFGSLTVHAALPNLSEDRFRLSVDFRFQEEGQPLCARVLKPHFERLDWDEIYSGWTSKKHQYYWHGKEYPVVEWDSSMHELPPEHMKEATAQTRAYLRRRAALRSNGAGTSSD